MADDGLRGQQRAAPEPTVSKVKMLLANISFCLSLLLDSCVIVYFKKTKTDLQTK